MDEEARVLALASDDASVFHVADEMTERGWYVQPQLARGGAPEALHLTLGPTQGPMIEPFLVDLAASLEAARKLPPPETLVPDLSNGLPRRMAPVHAQLNRLPPAEVEKLLVDFWGQIFA